MTHLLPGCTNISEPMAAPCLSSVLTNANLTMYPTGSLEVLQQHPTPTILPSINTLQMPNLNFTSGLVGKWYKQVNPQLWTEENVLDWISDQVELSKLDAATISLSYCSMNGSTICQLTQDQMAALFGAPLGLQLHHSLQELRAKHDIQNLSGTDLNETCQLLDNFLDNLSFPYLSTLRLGTEATDSRREFVYDLAQLSMDPMSPLRDSGYLSDSEHSSTSAGCLLGFPNPSSPESRSSDSDPEFAYPQISKELIKTERGEPKKRPRGRPPKLSKEHSSGFFENPKKNKHAPRGTHLWEFIRDILIHPERNQGLMKWEDRHEGVFKFLKSEAVAQMWGQKKKNSSMTYEKLSRAMRYYYKREILERVDGRRLVYKFGKNSSGWKIEEVGLAV